MQGLVLQFAPLVVLFAVFYFLMIRPQQKRAKEHQAAIMAVKRGDEVVLSSGIVGKVVRTDDTEALVEIAPKVEVKVVKAQIATVRTRGTPVVANDAKA